MEIKDILTIINAVSDSSLTSFIYEEGNIRLSLEADRGVKDVNFSKKDVFQADERESMKASGSLEPGKGSVITSPMVGIFYSAPAEGAENFVNIGDAVKKGQIVGIVEAMKLMNEIESPYDGVIKEILINNKDMIGYGQELMVIV